MIVERKPLVHDNIVKRYQDTLEDKVAKAARSLGKDIGVGVKDGVQLESLHLEGGKPNYARTSAQVYVAGKTAANLWVIAFKPGDATGDYSTKFPPGSLIVPEDLRSNSGDKGTYPRPKPQVAEIAIPLAHAETAHRIFGGTTLRLLTVAGEGEDARVTLVEGANFTPGSSVRFGGGSNRHDDDNFVTLGVDSFGRKVGDPHSLVNMSLDGDEEAVDVVAFLAAESEASAEGVDLMDLLGAFDPVNPYTR